MNERDYNQCLAYTKKCCNNQLNIEAEDVIGEAFLMMREKGQEYSFETIRGHIGKVLLKLRHQPKFVEFNGQKGVESSYNVAPQKEDLKQCKTCGQTLALSEFYVFWNRYTWSWFSYCKPCHKKKYNSNRKLKISRSYVIRLLKNEKRYSAAYLLTQSWIVGATQGRLIRKQIRKRENLY